MTTPQQRYTTEALQNPELWEVRSICRPAVRSSVWRREVKQVSVYVYGLQETDSFEEMLELCASGSDVVSPSHLAQTVLRAGRLLSHPRHQGERKAIQGDPRCVTEMAWYIKLLRHANNEAQMSHDALTAPG